MIHKFYDVKSSKKIKCEVLSKRIKKGTMANGIDDKYAFWSKSEDGRPLVAYVSKEEYDKATDVEEIEG